MSRRSILKTAPVLEQLDGRQLLSGVATGSHLAHLNSQQRGLLNDKFLAYRITNPKSSVDLAPPFQQLLVQSRQPVAGQVYNVLYVAVKNGTAQTFGASSGFTVRLNNQSKSRAFPILAQGQQWKPGGWVVFYVLTKKYYPVSPVAGGFQLDLGGASSTLVPGPSGIFLRLKYNPATFARTLNWIVAYGPGAEGGKGPALGLPDTAIDEIVSARTRRNDFGGHF